VATRTRDANVPPGYDASAFPAFAVTVDVVILTMAEGVLQVLLVRWGQEPFTPAGCRPSRPNRITSLTAIEDTARVTSGPGRALLVSALLGWGVNVVALLVIDEIFDGVEIGRWGSILLGAAVLGLANAFVKPVLALLTLPLIVITLGLAYFALNVGMLALAEWIAPEFSIDGFWTYVGATIVVWLVNWILNALLGSLD
jgi:putative membrane protein